MGPPTVEVPRDRRDRPEGAAAVTPAAVSWARWGADLWWVLSRVPGHRLVFLHVEYDRAWPLLERLARAYRRHALRRTCLVAVAGSVGKTTTKRALDAVLAVPDRRHSRSNYKSSLAENLLRTRPWDPHAVIEVGLGGPKWMASYARMLAPDVAVVTAVTSDHYPAFRTLEETRGEKVKILGGLRPGGLAVLNGDDPHVRWMASQTRARVRTFGFSEGVDVQATDLRLDWPRGTRFTLRAEGASQPVCFPLLGRYTVYAGLAAAAVGLSRGLSLPEIATRLTRLTPAPARMEVVQLPGDVWLVDDSFKGWVESVHAALDVLAEIPARRRVLVLGPVEDSAGDQEAVHRELGARIAGIAQRLIHVSDGLPASAALREAAVAAGMAPAAVSTASLRIHDVVRAVRADLRPGDVVFLKSASRFRLQRVSLALAGLDVRCPARVCRAKLRSCRLCPLLGLEGRPFENYFVRRYLPEA